MTDTTTPQPNAEDQPGYDGPAYDSCDRLRIWMEPSVPPADRDRLIAEHRDQVLTEAAELVADVRDQQYGPSVFKAERHALNRAHAALLAGRTTTAQEN